MIASLIRTAILRRSWPAAVAAILIAAAVWIWNSRAAALDDLRDAQTKIAAIETSLEAERQRRKDAEQIAEERRARDGRIEGARDECLESPLPADLWD